MKCPNEACKHEIEILFYSYCPYCGYNLLKFREDDKLMFTYATRLIKDKQYTDAIQFLKMCSKMNNSDAMYEYGILFSEGLGIPKNDSNVIYCMKKSSKLGNQKAILFLINSYRNNLYGLKSNFEEEKQLYFLLSNDNKLVFKGYYNEPRKEEMHDIAEDTPTIGEILDIKGNITSVPFETNEINDEAYNKEVYKFEEKYLDDFYNEMGEIVDNYNKSIKTKEDDINNLYNEFDKILYEYNDPHYYDKMIKLERKLIKPYVGKLSLREKNDTEIDVYVGKEDIFDSNNVQIVYSWFSPIGNLFYDNINTKWTIGSSKFTLGKKRIISIEERKLFDVIEVYNENMTSGKHNIVFDPYLIKTLELRHKNNNLSDIVSSIQYEQNQIIKYNSSKNIIMQGCAGCGKTSILFHRIKYIVGNYLKTNDDICVITPSVLFNNFLQPMIQDLDINNIVVYSIEDFYINILDNFTSNAKGQHRWKELFSNKKVLYENDDCLPSDVVESFYSKDFLDSVSELKTIKINTINFERIRKSEKGNVQNQLDILNSILGAKEKKLLPNYEHSINVLHKCELYALCLFYFKRCGIYKYQTKPYDKTDTIRLKYFDFNPSLLMIDEAQDISISEYRLLHSLMNKEAVYDFFGDIKQGINNYSLKNWSELKEIFGNISHFKINKNYRNTSEIIDFVNDECGVSMENVGYNGYAVQEIDESLLEKKFNEDSYEKKVVICAFSLKDELVEEHPSIANHIFETKRIKGMEFQSVYIYKKGMKTNEKYVAYTRALEKLTIIK